MSGQVRSSLRRVADVAAQLDVSPATVYRAIETGALRAVRFGKALRVSQEAILEYVRRCETASQRIDAEQVTR
ncbi:MAG: helix-turn-helix domain-containing protein [Pseudonocardia sp.]